MMMVVAAVNAVSRHSGGSGGVWMWRRCGGGGG